MLFSWLKKRRRRKLLAEPFPPGWVAVLERNVALYSMLPAPLQEKMRQIVRVFLAEKDWEGCRGLEMTPEVQVTIAALASVLILGQDDFFFDNVQTILVYPRGYKARRRHGLSGSAYIEATEEMLGEADYNGPIILAWSEVQAAAREPGHGENLVFHEFAHKVDMLSGDADGTPPMPLELRGRWQQIVKEEYEELTRAVEWHRESFLDPYGATSECEFFAVTTEAFFDNPVELRENHPELYALFADFYRLEPARWFEG